jgi:hypothetical protein
MSGVKTEDSVEALSKAEKAALIKKLLKNDEELIADLALELNSLTVKEDFLVPDWTDFIVGSKVTAVWFNVKTKKYYYINKNNVKTNIGKSLIQQTQLGLYKEKRMAKKTMNTKSDKSKA